MHKLFIDNLDYAALINNHQKSIYGDRMYADWLQIFLDRIDKNKYIAPISIDNFLRKEEIIIPLKAYDIDPTRFWVALNFAYDLTIDRTKHIRSDKKTIDAFREIIEYIDRHPKYKLYISDDHKIPVKNRCEIGNACFRYLFASMVRKYIADYDTPENKGIDLMTRYWDNDDEWFRLEESKNLGQTYRIYYMYELLNGLLQQLTDKRLRRLKNDKYTITYNKRQLIAQIIYMCELTIDIEGYVFSTDGLNGVIQQCKGRVEKFNVLSEVYTLL